MRLFRTIGLLIWGNIMDHREWIRIVPGSRKAVLMIHGIAGTPAHFRDLIPVIGEDWSVYNILLDGHGKTVRDFGATSMKKWKAQVDARLEELFANYDRIVLVAHSMGTLFSIQAAVKHPDKIDRLFLLAVPTRPWVRASTVATSLRISRGNLRPDDTAAWAMYHATSIQLQPGLLQYAGWVPRLLELLAECRKTRQAIPRLTVPCQTFQSHIDELVSFRSCKDLENHPCIENTVLYGSGHFAYSEDDIALLRERLAKTLD